MTASPRVHSTHSIAIGYILWLFGFTGAHRFYYGRQITGTIWFLTLGLLGIGWIIDVVLIPDMDRSADLRYHEGPINYSTAWVLLAFFGALGLHRLYMGKLFTGIIYFLTAGLFFVGWLYDLWTLNEQIDQINQGYVLEH